MPVEMTDAWLRRLAVQITAQLPDNPDAAVVVLGYAREIVDNFLRPRPVERPQAPAADQRVLVFPGSGSPNSPSDRASANARPSGLPS